MTVLDASGQTRADRPYDPADLSSHAFWRSTAVEREQTFARLRADRPVSWHVPVEDMLMEDPNDQGFWAVTRHADLVECTKRHDDFLSGEGIVMESIPQELLDAGQGFIAMDPPRHTKVRRLLSSAFTPKQIGRINDQIEANARRVVDDIARLGEVDFVHTVARLLPMHNICDMLGIAPKDREHLAHEAQYAGGWNDPELMGDDDPLTRMGESAINIAVLAQKNLDDRRAHPGTDLLSALVAAEVDGEKLSDAEITSFFALLTVAGNDTTRQSLSHGVRALTDFPDQKAWLMADLEARMPSAVEEMVRWASPIMTFRRTAARDCELSGAQITAGDKVVMFYASANWDTEVFDHPERLDLSRSPNPHVSFGGGGIHHCLGNQLARRQISALWRQLLTRLPDLEAVGAPDLAVSTFFHGVNHQTVRFTPEGSS